MEEIINNFLWMLNDEKYPDYNKKSKELTKLINKHLAAINYTRCCTELCDEERCSYTLNNNSKMCDDCGKVFG